MVRSSSLLVVAGIALLSQICVADLMIKEKQHTDAFKMMGKEQPAEDKMVTIWVGEKSMRSDGEKEGVLILLDKNQIIVINHEKKTYSEIPQDVFAATAQAAAPEGMPPEMAKMMASMMKMTVSVQPTNETLAVGKWSAKKYLQTIETGMSKSTTEMWATKDLKIAPELAAKYATAFYGRGGQMKELMGNLLTEMKKIEGYVVKTVTKTSVMNTEMTSSTEITEVKENVQAPAGTFEIPAKYKKKNWEE